MHFEYLFRNELKFQIDHNVFINVFVATFVKWFFFRKVVYLKDAKGIHSLQRQTPY